MKKKNWIFKQPYSVLLISIVLFSCTPLISPFDQYAYTQTTSIKVDALNLMDLATEDFVSHQAEVKSVQSNLQKIYEYDKNRPKNLIITKMWEKIMDTSGHLFGGFINRWKNEGHLNKTFIQDQKNGNVGPAFDQIAELESKLRKPS